MLTLTVCSGSEACVLLSIIHYRHWNYMCIWSIHSSRGKGTLYLIERLFVVNRHCRSAQSGLTRVLQRVSVNGTYRLRTSVCSSVRCRRTQWRSTRAPTTDARGRPSSTTRRSVGSCTGGRSTASSPEPTSRNRSAPTWSGPPAAASCRREGVPGPGWPSSRSRAGRQRASSTSARCCRTG